MFFGAWERKMSEKLLEKIDREIEAARSAVVADTIRFINIKSVNEKSECGAPFGKGPKAMLDEFYRTAKEDGFFVTDYGVGVVSAAMKEAPVDLGIWLHGDVVPEGEGWSFPPYDACEYQGCIIGRGACDNKGQLAAAYNLFKIFDKLGIKLKYNAAIYLGSDEESGKRDIVGMEGNPDAKGFINVATPPAFSLVPDSGFPIAYGGFGSLIVKIKSKNPLSCCDFVAGSSSAPGLATARFNGAIAAQQVPEGCEMPDEHTLTAYTLPRHGANPDPAGNMITVLSRAIIDMPCATDADKRMLSVIRDLSLDIYGEWHPAVDKSDKFTRLVVYPKSVDMQNGCPELTLTIRYPYGFTFDGIVGAISSFAEAHEFEISHARKISTAYCNEKDTHAVRLLTDIANDICGEKKEPYVVTGGTYAHELPNAYVYGTGSNVPPSDFPKGRGGAHGVDEAASVDRLIRMMRIYARALLALEEVL